ncbi:MAG: lysine--tRNA ligase [candidate division Zixibacteria bacterium]|nr:lysine--tRNA ligase [candidate division Zixibacteria bacterium]MDH3936836.1 lysine--tRNA ligase [candidate division Zixibacteria bacterium]MDH4033347.1 lysine--tRNA ligase [candidate division Zixibacteria bacterium]
MTDKTTQPDPNEAAPEQIQIPLLELIKTRRQKVTELSAAGINLYPYRYERSHHIKELLDQFDQLATDETAVRLAGRVMLKRKMGKSIFADVRDSTERLQVYVKLNNVGQEQFDLFDTLDLGDILGCEGSLFTTRTGERTLKVTTFEILTKTLHPLPDKHAGLTDVETRSRRRYADLIANPEVRDDFAKRSRIVRIIRDFLNSESFLEVETPILQPLYGGGMALPFKTHHNRLDRDLYLRIADELYLKRLIVGGFDKVWEFCKDFRNEGIDRLHNPEFTMIEMYWAYADYHDMAKLFEQMLRRVVFELHGRYKIPYGDNEIDFEPKFKWISMIDSITEQTGVDFYPMSFDEATTAAKNLGVEGEELINRGKVIEAVWEAKVEPCLIQPTFIVDFPVEISPLAKKHREKAGLTERFELFISGLEMGNAFSELNDPVDQLQRFMQQGKALEAGDEEAQILDDDFITALMYGMPPTAGLGFGIDRLVMLLTNKHNIRDVLLFPQMKDMKEGSVPVSKILAQVVEEEETDGPG